MQRLGRECPLQRVGSVQRLLPLGKASGPLAPWAKLRRCRSLCVFSENIIWKASVRSWLLNFCPSVSVRVCVCVGSRASLCRCPCFLFRVHVALAPVHVRFRVRPCPSVSVRVHPCPSMSVCVSRVRFRVRVYVCVSICAGCRHCSLPGGRWACSCTRSFWRAPHSRPNHRRSPARTFSIEVFAPFLADLASGSP